MVARYGIEVHKSSEVVEVDPGRREVVVADLAGDTKETIGYDFLHVVPPQSAQAPVVVRNLRATMAGKPAPARYDGYPSCPLTTARNKMLLAEFDYTLQPRPTFPLIDTTRERTDMWYLKRYGLPAMYWNFMLKGLA